MKDIDVGVRNSDMAGGSDFLQGERCNDFSIGIELLCLIKHMKHRLVDVFSRADGLANGLIQRGQLFWRTCP